MPHRTVIIICGPTAVGKTAIAVALAKALQTDIISADSRQCFKELNFGVAKPSCAELQAVHHYFINSHSIHQEVNAAVFEQYALDAAQKIFQKSPYAIMVGGTGLYIKAFSEGIDSIPSIHPSVRAGIISNYQTNGLEYLQRELAEKDPAFWAIAEQQNPQRLIRALEVLLSTGKSITHFRSGNKTKRPFRIIKVGLELPREQLYNQINSRVDRMMEQGLVDEAKSLLPYRHLNALQTVGYREIFEHLDNSISLEVAITNIKTNTRHYAKRQITWLKKEDMLHWLHPSTAANELLSLVQSV